MAVGCWCPGDWYREVTAERCQNWSEPVLFLLSFSWFIPEVSVWFCPPQQVYEEVSSAPDTAFIIFEWSTIFECIFIMYLNTEYMQNALPICILLLISCFTNIYCLNLLPLCWSHRSYTYAKFPTLSLAMPYLFNRMLIYYCCLYYFILLYCAPVQLYPG